MSGHSKWSKIKRGKAVTDAKRSQIWARIIREIQVAARDGGGDIAGNPRLALAIAGAKSENMPKDNMERAIKRGTGELEGANLEEHTFEGYAPGGVAVFVECLTDNNNRTVADVRHAFGKFNGSLGTKGTVAYLFERKGLMEVPAEGLDEMELFELVADAGAEDLEQHDDSFMITVPLEAFGSVQSALAGADIVPTQANLERVPTTTIKLAANGVQKVMRLVDALENLDDVQAVYSALEMDDEAISAME